ncbi:DUF2071 domain-containing protein [Aquimarina sp. M1]
MTIREILKNTDIDLGNYRKHPRNFIRNGTKDFFLHWKVAYNTLQKFVPKELEIDTFEDSPWGSLVALSIEKIRPKNLPHYHPYSPFS